MEDIEMSRRYKNGVDRSQGLLLPPRVEEYVGEDNPVRAIDAYAESLDLEGLGFKHAAGSLSAGRPSYAPQALLKLYLYGYLMRIRSSRLLERETHRNLELIWLLEGLRPSHATIADFRKHNAKALKAANRDFVMLCKELDLYGGELAAIDGSFFRGNVAKENIYTASRLQKLLARIEKDIDHYHQALEAADKAGGAADNAGLAEKLVALKARQARHQKQLATLEKSGETQYAEVDKDARLLTKNAQRVAGYNVQLAVDAKHKLLIHCEVTGDGNDTGQLAPMAQAAKATLGVETLDVAADAGYYNQVHLKACLDNGITPYVPAPRHPSDQEDKGRLPRSRFVFEADSNRYRCPEGQRLLFDRRIDKQGKIVLHYRSDRQVCAGCPRRERCLPKKTPYREIYRWEHEALAEAHDRRMAEAGAAYMKRRAGMAEHPFGTLKRWCGWDHFLVRGKTKVSGEMNLLMLCYNFKRVLRLLGLEKFRDCLAQRARQSPQAIEHRAAGASLRLLSSLSDLFADLFSIRIRSLPQRCA
ncbi:MAG TPA: IS1182 family transposase [Burkholderiales bacterium]|nr:IS1182 family transposase [Burkholderiales bacterium]